MKRLLPLLAAVLLLCACGSAAPTDTRAQPAGEAIPLQYAERFTADRYPGGAFLLTLGEKEQYWLLPEGIEPPFAPELPAIPIPVDRVYLASSSVADFFLQLDALDAVAYTSTKPDSWQLPEIREALEQEQLLYVGRYSAPDYELLLTEGCGLVVENTMILHSPATRERLEALGFPLLVEYSSYETHPLGRVEWIKLYGLLTGKLEEAEQFFDRQVRTFASLSETEDGEKSVAFFHITANGAVTVRKSNDYVTRMIELAGGRSAVTELPPDDSALSTMTIQMESFYAQARDADILIYNGTIGEEISTVGQLLELSPLLADFKAVASGQLWCTEQSMFQRSTAAADMIADFHAVLCGESVGDLHYLHPIQQETP